MTHSDAVSVLVGPRACRICVAGSPTALAALFADRAASALSIIGVLPTDDPSRRLQTDLPVFRNADEAAAAFSIHGPRAGDSLVFVGPLAPRERVRALVAGAVNAGLAVKMLRRVDRGYALAPVAIDDLVEPEPAPIERGPIAALLTGKRVLVTGGGGSIGAELTRRIAQLAPESLTVLENSECNLFEIDHELGATHPDLERVAALCDIRDQRAVLRWFERARPEIVFHAAALKQVPLLESHPSEAALTNVWGTKVVVQAADAAGAHLVYVSTDKAVNPSSVMGATKRLGEVYCQALDRVGHRADAPRKIVVRLGNVLGSAGSVTPLFDRQIAAGGPVTITHSEIERYFITVRRAADFILQAGAYGLDRADLRGATFLLEMGKSIRVLDLAHDMIHLAGKRPDVDIEVRTIGLRPGEKLHEDLLAPDEWLETETPCGLRALMSPSLDPGLVTARVEDVIARARLGRDDAVRALARAPLAIAQGALAEAASG